MAKKEISFKQIGQNVIVIVDGQQFTKKMAEKSDRESLKEKILTFNKKNTVTLQKEIVAVFTVQAEATKEKIAKVAKIQSKVTKAKEVIVKKTKAIVTGKTKAVRKLATKVSNAKTELLITDLEKAESLSEEEVARLAAVVATYKKPEAPVENKPTRRTGEH